MFLMAIKKMTSTETHVPYDTYMMYRPVCYRMHILPVPGKLFHMQHTGLICPDNMINNNQERPLDGSYIRYDWTDCYFITLFTPHISNKAWHYKSIRVYTICNLITIVHLYHIIHIMNGNIYCVIVYEKQTNFNHFFFLSNYLNKKSVLLRYHF